MSITEQPRVLNLNGVSFSEEELTQLKSYYKKKDVAVFEKSDVREKNPVIQKAIIAGALFSLSIAEGAKVSLSLTQNGRALLGKV